MKSFPFVPVLGKVLPQSRPCTHAQHFYIIDGKSLTACVYSAGVYSSVVRQVLLSVVSGEGNIPLSDGFPMSAHLSLASFCYRNSIHSVSLSLCKKNFFLLHGVFCA